MGRCEDCAYNIKGWCRFFNGRIEDFDTEKCKDFWPRGGAA